MNVREDMLAVVKMETVPMFVMEDAKIRFETSFKLLLNPYHITGILQGTCVTDELGNPFCQCVGSFTGDDCETKSEFAYIAGGNGK